MVLGRPSTSSWTRLRWTVVLLCNCNCNYNYNCNCFTAEDAEFAEVARVDASLGTGSPQRASHSMKNPSVYPLELPICFSSAPSSSSAVHCGWPAKQSVYAGLARKSAFTAEDAEFAEVARVDASLGTGSPQRTSHSMKNPSVDPLELPICFSSATSASSAVQLLLARETERLCGISKENRRSTARQNADSFCAPNAEAMV
jgi:hypothetical protein